MIKKPTFWDYKKPNLISFFLIPFTIPIIVNNFLNSLKKNSYFSKTKKKYEIKTICVGNIYIGGTGKTPIAIKINQILSNLNYRTVFIKKNHTESFDEEKLLKKHGRVLSGPKRIETLIQANKDNDVAIFDDGLQDVTINYDLKFVCFNTKNLIGNGMLIPAGPLREKINSLKNYDAVILSGNNENSDQAITIIKKYNKDIKIFQSTYTLENIDKIDKRGKYVAFAGIGNPNNFYTTLINSNFNIVEFLGYPDHKLYSDSDIKKIVSIAKTLDAKILTTEKDYLRLEILKDYDLLKNIQYIKMNLQFNDEDKFISFIKSAI